MWPDLNFTFPWTWGLGILTALTARRHRPVDDSHLLQFCTSCINTEGHKAILFCYVTSSVKFWPFGGKLMPPATRVCPWKILVAIKWHCVTSPRIAILIHADMRLSYLSHTSKCPSKNVWKYCVKWTSTLKVILRPRETQTTRLEIPANVTLCWLCDENLSLCHSVSIFRMKIKFYHADVSSMEIDVCCSAMWCSAGSPLLLASTWTLRSNGVCLETCWLKEFRNKCRHNWRPLVW